MSGFSKFLDFLVREKYIEKNFLNGFDRTNIIKKNREVISRNYTKWIPEEELSFFISNLITFSKESPDSFNIQRDILVIAILVFTGLRASELVNIKVDDIDLFTNLEPKQVSEALNQNDIKFYETGIDHGHHAGNAYRALEDTVALSDAVQWVVDNVDLADTLILVTADHSHTLTISGYPKRGNPILGIVEAVPGVPTKDATGLPYTTLSYANGPGYRRNRPDLSKVNTEDSDYLQLVTVPMMVETHAGEDVAAFAVGLNSEKVRGVMEQNELFGVMRGALFPKK